MMKEKTNPKSVAPHKVKGTVLFTVVTVMMILIVFLMGALALAATANQRAMNTYSTVQTQATAKAGVNAIISAMRNDISVATVAQGVNASNQRENIGQIVITADGDEQLSLGKITDSYIEYVGSKWVVENVDGSDQLVEKSIIKICATAEQGSAKSTYATYIMRGSDDNSTPGESQGFIATGSATSNNHTSVYGGAYIGFDDAQRNLTGLPDPSAPYTKYYFSDAHSTYETDMQVNGSLYNDSGSSMCLVVKGPGTGLTVWGDMVLSHPFVVARAKAPATATTDNTKDAAVRWDLNNNPIDPQNVPYIYVEGALKFGGTTKNVNTIPTGSTYGASDTPLNIFCGTLDIQPNVKDDMGNQVQTSALDITGNIYMYEPNATSYFKVEFNGTRLKKWVGKVSGATSDVSGSIYSKGNLEMSAFGEMDGDLCVDGNLTVDKIANNSDLIVNGTVKVGGMLELKNGAKIQAKKVMCDGYVGTAKDNITATDGKTGTGLRGTATIASSTTTKPSMKAGYTYEFSNKASVQHNVEVFKQDTFAFAILKPDNTVLYKDKNNGRTGAELEGDILWGDAAHSWKITDIPGITAGCRIERNVKLNTDEKETVKVVVTDVSGNELFRDAGTDHTLTLECDGKLYEGSKAICKGADVTYKDTTGTVVSQSEAVNMGATSFFDGSGNPVSRVTFMPPEYEKDAILGTTGDPTKANLKFIKTVPEILNSAADPYKTFTDVPEPHKSVCENAANVHTNPGGIEMSITDDCTLKGNFSSTKITVVAPDPKDKPEGIWIVLDKFWLEGGYIVIDDETNVDATTGKIGAVNFMVRNACGCGASSAYSIPQCGYFCTTSIAEKLTNSQAYQIYTDEKFGIGSFTNTTDADGNAVTKFTEDPAIPRLDPPNVFMYSAETGASFAMKNNQTMSVMMKAPYMDFDQQSMGGVSFESKANKLYYNGFDISKAPATNLGDFGCVICHNFKCGNNWLLLFAGNDGGGSGKKYDDALLNSWTIMYDDFC